jgi:hypothetical protein
MFKCKICDKEFADKNKYAGHMSGHSRVGKLRKDPVEYIKVCQQCGKEFRRTRGKFCSLECSRKHHRDNTFYKGMDITLTELDRYRETHNVCEICGRPETIKINGNDCNLAVDHDHSTNHFRGLLCYSCNTKLSWYENWKNNIEAYLEKN